MIKQELSKEISSKLEDISPTQVTEVLDLMVLTIKEELSNDGVIDIRGFGKFRLNRTNERMGRNPKTGEEVVIPAKDIVKFKMSQGFKYPNEG